MALFFFNFPAKVGRVMFIIAGENRWHLALNVNKAEQFKIIEKHAIHILPKTI